MVFDLFFDVLPPFPVEENIEEQVVENQTLEEEIPGDQVPGEEVPEDDALKVTNELPPISSEQVSELDRKFSAPAGPGMSSMTRTLLIVVAILLVVMLYFMFRQKDNPVPIISETSTEEQDPALVTENLQPQDESTATQGSSEIPTESSDQEVPPPVFILPDEVFQGTAPMEVRQEGPVVSVEVDSEIAAFVDALKVRVGIINGSKTAERSGINTKITSGLFQGFNIINTKQQKGDEIIKDETVVITPSKGRIIVKNNFLDSLWKLDREKLQQELETAGLEIIKKEVNKNKRVNI